MGSLYQVEPPTLLQDLKVSIKNISILYPSQQTEKRSMFLSNIDQVLNFDVQTMHFFESNNDFPPHLVAEKLKTALQNILVPYDFLAGRLKLNIETGRLEFDCNGAGIGFVEASSEYKLEEIGDLSYPNPAFEQLFTKTMSDSSGNEDKPLCIIQVTSFKCGGFSMAVQTNHATFDGLSFKTFLDNLAAFAADKPLAVTPCNERLLLSARSPPHVAFDHPEMVVLQLPPGHDHSAPVFDSTKDPLDFKIFHLSPTDISRLKDKAKASNDDRVSGFNAVTALIWRCKALSSTDQDLGRVSRILYAVNIRPRLVPPLPDSYTGNAVLTAYGSAKLEEVKEVGLSELVGRLKEGSKRVDNEYARSLIDWGEVHKGFINGEVLVSSWWRLGFEDVGYPWGCPKYSCPLVHHMKDIILLFPDIHDKHSVNVLVSLPHPEMITFQFLFQDFLSHI